MGKHGFLCIIRARWNKPTATCKQVRKKELICFYDCYTNHYSYTVFPGFMQISKPPTGLSFGALEHDVTRHPGNLPLNHEKQHLEIQAGAVKQRHNPARTHVFGIALA